jgi:hypothetical protein
MVMCYHIGLAAGHVSSTINVCTDDAPAMTHFNELASTEIGKVWTYETSTNNNNSTDSTHTLQFVVDEDGDNAELGFENHEDDLLEGDAKEDDNEDEQWVDDEEFLAMNDMYGLY